MEIHLEWQPLISLENGSDPRQIYCCALELIPARPGIYVFARMHGAAVFPLYVGQAKLLRTRIKAQFNNLKLMKAIENQKNGERILMTALLQPRGRQTVERLLPIVESAYIEHALAANPGLLNQKGTKTPRHTISSSGKMASHAPFPRQILHQAKR